MTERIPAAMDLEFTGDLWYWRGPSPYYFVTVPDQQSLHLHEVSRVVTYRWGMIPVRARIGSPGWTTSLFPKDGTYLVPVKDAVRRAEGLDEGDTIAVRLVVAGPR